MFDRPAKGFDAGRFPRIARIGRVAVDEGGGLLSVDRVEGHAAPSEAAESREVAGDDGTVAPPRPLVEMQSLAKVVVKVLDRFLGIGEREGIDALLPAPGVKEDPDVAAAFGGPFASCPQHRVHRGQRLGLPGKVIVPDPKDVGGEHVEAPVVLALGRSAVPRNARRRFPFEERSELGRGQRPAALNSAQEVNDGELIQRAVEGVGEVAREGEVLADGAADVVQAAVRVDVVVEGDERHRRAPIADLRAHIYGSIPGARGCSGRKRSGGADHRRAGHGSPGRERVFGVGVRVGRQAFGAAVAVRAVTTRNFCSAPRSDDQEATSSGLDSPRLLNENSTRPTVGRGQ